MWRGALLLLFVLSNNSGAEIKHIHTHKYVDISAHTHTSWMENEWLGASNNNFFPPLIQPTAIKQAEQQQQRWEGESKTFYQIRFTIGILKKTLCCSSR
jgi:hypothetical protein